MAPRKTTGRGKVSAALELHGSLDTSNGNVDPMLSTDEANGQDVGHFSDDEMMDLDGMGEGEGAWGPGDMMEHEGDEENGGFNRLLSGIRGNYSAGSSSLLAKDWDKNVLNSLDEEFGADDADADNDSVGDGEDWRDELRGVSGVGRSRPKSRKGTGKKRRTLGYREPALTPEIQALLGQANIAYVSSQYEEAIGLFQQIITLQPNVPVVWTTLAECYKELGDEEREVGFRIMAAHLRHDGEEWKELGRRSRIMDKLQQAIYCYKQAIMIDPKDLDAIWDRSYLLKETGNAKKALEGFLALLRVVPHDINILSELRFTLVETSNIPMGAQIFQAALDHQISQYPNPNDPAVIQNVDLFQVKELLTLADFYLFMKEYERVIVEIKRGVRWLDGRISEIEWELFEDDREFHRAEEFGGDDRHGAYGGKEIDINLRHRLGLARLHNGEIAEAKRHFAYILGLEPRDYWILWSEIGEAYLQKHQWFEAHEIYLQLAQNEEAEPIHVESLGDCEKGLGEYQSALECYQAVSDVTPDNLDIKMKIAHIYEILNEPGKALKVVTDVIEQKRAKKARGNKGPEAVLPYAPAADPSASLFDEAPAKRPVKDKSARLSAEEQETKRKQEVIDGFAKLKELKSSVDGGDKVATTEWLDISGTLIDRLRETKSMFPQTSRDKKFSALNAQRSGRKSVGTKTIENQATDMMKRLERALDYDGAPTESVKEEDMEFRGIAVTEWFELLIEYSFILTKNGDVELAVEVLEHLHYAVIFMAPERSDRIKLAVLACTIYANDQAKMVDAVRKIILRRQYNNTALTLLCTSLGGGLVSAESFANLNLQKFLLRDLKSWTSAYEGQDIRWQPRLGRWINKAGGDVDDDEKDDQADEDNTSEADLAHESGSRFAKIKTPTKLNPIVYMYYGQMMMMAKSYQSSIAYLLHAYKMNPYDPLTSLLLAVSYIGRAIQRQCDNRHYCIVQGLGFLSEYRRIHPSGEGCEEVEYNFGRFFHTLGLHHLAVNHYKRVLSRAEELITGSANPTTIVREAAYNLSLIYSLSGSTGLAKTVTQKWLTV